MFYGAVPESMSKRRWLLLWQWKPMHAYCEREVDARATQKGSPARPVRSRGEGPTVQPEERNMSPAVESESQLSAFLSLHTHQNRFCAVSNGKSGT